VGRSGGRLSNGQKIPTAAMESVIPLISDRDYMNGSRKEEEGGLEASPFADGNKFSSRPRMPAVI